MKKNFFAVLATIVVICVANVQNASAQRFYDFDRGGLFCNGVDFYVGFGAGAGLVNDMASPTFNVRVGADTGLFIGELEGSYLSMNSVWDSGYGTAETNTLSTMTLGVNLGVKFLASELGHLALMVHTGYALQEEWFHGDYYYHDYHGHAYHGRYYFGVGVNASVNLSRRISLFGEARYQSIPIDGMGEIKWGGVFTGGIKFYF